MENLSENVYECNLAVEAHMICDLLSQAGISARVDGAFLQSAAGEIPLGNTVKVRVDPSRAAEAREVIADWEKLQPPGDPGTPAPKPSRLGSAALLILGAIAGGSIIALATFFRPSSNGIDYNGDGHLDTFYNYVGDRPKSTEFDRNFDRKIDARWTFDRYGYEDGYQADDDFNGEFEWRAEVAGGSIERSVLDADGDGRPEQAWHFRSGVVERVDFYFASGGRIVKRQFFKDGLLDSAEFDDDGDGTFERRVRYDRIGEPVL